MINGGIPQLLNMTAHLDKWAADIVRILPDPAWSGVANLGAYAIECERQPFACAVVSALPDAALAPQTGKPGTLTGR